MYSGSTAGVGGGSLATKALTVTVNDVVAEYPSLSVAVQVTVVVPIENTEPDGGSHVTLGVPCCAVAAGAM